MHNPGIGQVIVSTLLLSQTFFNSHAIHEREPWFYHYKWNGVWWRLQGKQGEGGHID